MQDMTKEDAEKILYPNVKALTFEEGFEVYKKFYKQSLNCGTSLNVEGFEPVNINGYRIYDENGKEIIDANDDVIKVHYKWKLEGVEGDYNY